MPVNPAILQAHTHTHAASAHLSCTSRLETAHFGGSESALDLQCVHVQISKGMHIEALLSGIKGGTYAEDVGCVYLLRGDGGRQCDSIWLLLVCRLGHDLIIFLAEAGREG